MKKYIVTFNLGKGEEHHELWASNAHNAEQMTIGWLLFYLHITQEQAQAAIQYSKLC